jgi:hypothetical protein
VETGCKRSGTISNPMLIQFRLPCERAYGLGEVKTEEIAVAGSFAITAPSWCTVSIPDGDFDSGVLYNPKPPPSPAQVLLAPT